MDILCFFYILILAKLLKKQDMKVEVKVMLVCLLFTFSNLLFSQQKISEAFFKKEIKERSSQFIDEANFNKAQLFFLKGKWDSTLIYSMKQLNAKTDIKELNDYCHFFRGFSFNKKKIFKEAQKEFENVSNDFAFHYHIKMILGGIALEQKKYRKAISYFDQIEQFDEKELLGIRKSNIEHNLGISYLPLKEYDKAEFYLVKSAKRQEADKDSLLIIGAYGDIANLYYEQYKDDLAIPYFEKAYEMSKRLKGLELKKIDVFDSKRKTARNMAVVEENRKNFKTSLTYRKESERWKDSLNNQTRIWEVAQVEKKFAVEKKQEEVSSLEKENKKKISERNRLFYFSIVLLGLLMTVGYFYREKIKANKTIRAQKETLDELNATKDKLFSIVSHDLRSSVNALKTSNTKLLDNLETRNLKVLDGLLQSNSAIVNGAYNLLDNLLHWALLQTKQSYFKIESIRLFFIVEQMAYNYKPLMLDKYITFENNVLKKDIVFADQESLKIILRNLLDNAIKFSIMNGFIKVYTQNTSENYCELVIEDSGLGMDEATRLELLKDTVLLSKKKNEDIIGTGLGLQLCKSIIKKNKGVFSIESELGKGTKMIVYLSKTLPNG